MAADPRVGVDDVVIPVVGECDDSWLSDARIRHVQPDDAGRAVSDAKADFEQGAIGAGAGMSCFDWKGGIGSSSRRAGDHTVGVLLLTNFGSREQLRVDGVPVGKLLDERPDEAPSPGGSCIAVVATDAPLTPPQLERLARRAGLGLARAGSVAHHGSGEIFVAFADLERAVVPRLRARSALPGGGRRDRGGSALLALGGGRHDRTGGTARPGAPAREGARALPRAAGAVVSCGDGDAADVHHRNA